jgi:hypothetical protein
MTFWAAFREVAKQSARDALLGVPLAGFALGWLLVGGGCAWLVVFVIGSVITALAFSALLYQRRVKQPH